MEIGGVVAAVAVVVVLAVLISLYFWKRKNNSLKIAVEKDYYHTGEVIKGKVTLNIKEPLASDKLIVGLKCLRDSKNQILLESEKEKKILNNLPIVEFNQLLKGPKSYLPGEYIFDFTIKLPSEAAEKPEVPLEIDKAAKALIDPNVKVEWYLFSELLGSNYKLSRQTKIFIG